MLIVELSMDLSRNNVLGGHRRLQKLLLLAGVGCEQRQLRVLFREKMELEEPLSTSALDTHLKPASMQTWRTVVVELRISQSRAEKQQFSF